MAEPILEVTALMKRFGGLIATNDLSLTVERGETHAIIAPTARARRPSCRSCRGC